LAKLPAFTKPALSTPDLVKLLQARGLTIADVPLASHYLNNLGFYRLSGYMIPFQKGGNGPDRHDFLAGTTFEDVLDRYVLDRKLRLLAMDAIERIEIAIRSALINSVSPKHSPHWYQDSALFDPTFNHADFIQKIKDSVGHDPAKARNRTGFVQHYYDSYSSPDMPPCWMVFEQLSFGPISHAFTNLRHPEHVDVCLGFGVKHGILKSWIHAISYVRNLCAHHARLWNRTFVIKPIAAKPYKADLLPTDKLYAQLVVMQVLMTKIAPDNHWAQKLKALIDEHPKTPLDQMGFPADWATRPLWKLPP
jgi:abortive infection bacteriophage resistance protein